MKTLSTILFFLFMSQNISATEFYLSHESRGILFGNNSYPVAEIGKDRTNWNERTGTTVNLESDQSYSHNTGMGIRFKEGLDIGLFYSQLWNSSEKTDPDHFAGTIPLHTAGWGHFQNGGVGYGSTLGSATNDYHFWNLDIESGYSFKWASSPGLQNVIFRIMVGLRYAEFNQNMVSNTSWVARGDPLTTPLGKRELNLQRIVNLNIKGLGPRFGASATFPIGDFNLIVGGSYSILFSQRDITDDHLVDNVNLTWFNDDGYNKQNEEMTIYNFDVNGGFQYDYKITEESSLIFEFGYRYAAYEKVRTDCGLPGISVPLENFYGKCKPNVFYNGTQRQKLDHLSSDFISHGPYLKIGFTY